MVKAGQGKIVWTLSAAGVVKVATVNPGAYRTGFNDTGMEAMDQWWDQDERTVAHWPVRKLDRQYEPEEMIQAIIEVIEADRHADRTVRPHSAEEMVRREQQEEWTISV